MPRADTLRDATRSYEAWLGERVSLVKADLAHKHQLMATAPLDFLRGTFYRWVQLWPEACADAAAAPRLLAVGDLHTENFGTWRDAEGRLVWGVNDFDEAAMMAYTNDLVRLATSARLAIAAGSLRLGPRDACAAILGGYRSGIESGGRPFVLADGNGALRDAALSQQPSPERFWADLEALPRAAAVPRAVAALLRAALPRGARARFRRRRAGVGSLGHPRFVAIAEWLGGRVAREAKALVPSACEWSGRRAARRIAYATVVRAAVRAADLHLTVRAGWVVRRIAPDCARVGSSAAAAMPDHAQLLRAMGAETANVHLGASRASVSAVRRDLAGRPEGWLRQASKTMERVTLSEFKEWAGLARV